MTTAIPTVSFTEAWANCKRLLTPGFELHLVLRSTGQCIALISNGSSRRWAEGSDEIAALHALEFVLLDELTEAIQ